MANRRERATVRDVAKLSGVSEISVSRVMRNAPHISEALREKVRRAADELGYTPNRLAGALKTNSSNLVAVVVPSMSNVVFPEVLDGIETVLAAAGKSAVLGVTHYDRSRETAVVRDMLSWAPSGVILAGTAHDPAVSKMLEEASVPVVQIMDIDGEPLQTVVGISHQRAAEAVADYLVDRGYERPGYIGAWGERPDRSRSRRLAFEARLEEQGRPLRARVIRAEASSASVGAAATDELLTQDSSIDCIFYANDDLALGGLFYCLRRQIEVPTALGVIGFNGVDMGLATPVRLTSVETPRFEMGAHAADVMLAMARGDRHARRIDLGFRIREGESC